MNTCIDNECVICLEEVDKHTNFKCKLCKNIFHTKCIYNLKEKKCPLCREEIKIEIKSKHNCIFNNMNDNDIYDVDKYISKWVRKTCISNNHKFCLETLGDWEMSSNELIFKYTCMYIECADCNISTIIK